LSIKGLPSNDPPLCIILQMTNIQDVINDQDDETDQEISDAYSENTGQSIVSFEIDKDDLDHQQECFIRSDRRDLSYTPQVFHCQRNGAMLIMSFHPLRIQIAEIAWGNGTSTAQIPIVSPPQHIFRI